MRRTYLFPLMLAPCVLAGSHAAAQALPTASRPLTPSVFGGVTGVYTGLARGRNLSITAGFDLTFCPNAKLQPAVEYRGLYALRKGGVDSLKNNLGGFRISAHYGRLRPYADLLVGRGETTYANGGYQVPSKLIFYTQSSSNVYSLGGGTDIVSTAHLALKADLQAQRYSSPVTPSGHLYSETGTLGLTYIFHSGRGIR